MTYLVYKNCTIYTAEIKIWETVLRKQRLINRIFRTLNDGNPTFLHVISRLRCHLAWYHMLRGSQVQKHLKETIYPLILQFMNLSWKKNFNEREGELVGIQKGDKKPLKKDKYFRFWTCRYLFCRIIPAQLSTARQSNSNSCRVLSYPQNSTGRRRSKTI